MTRRAVVLGALVAAIGAAPGHATEFQLGGHASWSATGDAAMCFSMSPGSLVAGTATASGLVRTGPLQDVPDLPDLPDLPDVVGDPVITLAVASTVVADVRPLVSASGYSGVCVGGTGLRATMGTVTFTLDLHGSTADYVTVVECSYSWEGPDCS